MNDFPKRKRLFRSMLYATALCIVAASPPQRTWAGPLIVAHRGGTGDSPENTLQAFSEALKNRADVLWMTVQATHDGVPVLYRPAELSALTDGRGKVSEFDFAAVRKLNAGYMFRRDDASRQALYPYRDHPVRIPTLREALRAIPRQIPVIVDLKQAPAAPLVRAVSHVLDETNAWSRVHIYSTNDDAISLMRQEARAQVFESRGDTRARLLEMAINGTCLLPPAPGTWIGMELHRRLQVVEHYTLGAGVTEIDAHWWTPAVMQCVKSRGGIHVVVFGIDTPGDYATAAALGVDAVMTNSPRTLHAQLNRLPESAR